MALSKITNLSILDDTIVNADINNVSAAKVTAGTLATARGGTGGSTYPPTSGLAASAIDSGTIATARLGRGTASSTTVLYGDQTYKTEPSPEMEYVFSAHTNEHVYTHNVESVLELANEDLDADGVFDPSTYRWTCPEDGIYYFYLHLKITNPDSGGYIQQLYCNPFKNTNQITIPSIYWNDTDPSFSITWNMTAFEDTFSSGDYVEWKLYLYGSGARTGMKTTTTGTALGGWRLSS